MGRGRCAVPNTVRILGTSNRERVRSTTASKTRCILAPSAKIKVAAVLELIDSQPVAESAARLLVEIQPEAQTRGVDPALADLAHPTYSRILRQGICDPGQARRVATAVKQLPTLVNAIPVASARWATYSWPLRMICAPNGGCPDILTVTCPHWGSMMWNE